MTDYDRLWQIITDYDRLWQLMTDYDWLGQIMIDYDKLSAVCCLFSGKLSPISVKLSGDVTLQLPTSY